MSVTEIKLVWASMCVFKMWILIKVNCEAAARLSVTWGEFSVCVCGSDDGLDGAAQ